MKIIQAQNIAYLGFIKKENKNVVENLQKFVVNGIQKQTIVPLRSNNIGVLTFGRKIDNQNKIIKIASKYINPDLNNLKKVSSTLMFEKDKALNVYKKLKDDKSLQENDRITIANLVYCQNYSEIYKMANEIENLPNDLDYDKDYKDDNRFDNKTKDVINFAKNVVKTMSVKNTKGVFILHDAENHYEEEGYSEQNPKKLAKYLKSTLAYELAVCKMQNKDFFRLLKSACNKNVDVDLSRNVEKVYKILKHNKDNIRLSSFRLSPKNVESEILKNEGIVSYYDTGTLTSTKSINKNSVPVIKLNEVRCIYDNKQKEIFKSLGFKDGTSWENLRLLIHSINCVKSLEGIDKLNKDIKPDTVLSTSTYSKNKNQVYAAQGFIMSNCSQILYGKANQDEIFSGSAKSRRQVGKWLDPEIDLSPNTLEGDKENCNEIMTIDNKVAAVYIKEDLYNDETRFNKNNNLIKSLLHYAKENNLPIIVLP